MGYDPSMKIWPVSWLMFDAGILKLGTEMIKEHPKAIVGISRGGLIPAIALSHRFRIGRVHPIYISSYTTSNLIIDVNDEMIELMRKPGTIVVDDIIDEGDTLSIVRGMAPNVPFYALVARQERHMDHAVYKAPADGWVEFPWERAGRVALEEAERPKTPAPQGEPDFLHD